MVHEKLPKTKQRVINSQGLPKRGRLLENSLSVKPKMRAGNEYKKGLWTEEEDRILLEHIRVHGRGHWNRIPKVTGHNINFEHMQNSTEIVENQNSAETSNWEPEMMNQHYHKESLLFPSDFYLNLYSPGLMEFLDEYPLDQNFQNN
ncbi:hypothetical protein Pint_22975 [Pistacia integerrima]|uniref:Uncharacterized protein n=1 Tax=Pistacia integerrima TaxID=434235 RepID=A0ACC0YL90_9ROSI|nr:hypothetical protein Pint_22975 [Pistacia integerrima]